MAKGKKAPRSESWLMPFSDMLLLLVVMFVLFLSFSEVDSENFRRNAGPIAEAFNQPLDHWDVSNATDMRSMFSGAKVFNQPLSFSLHFHRHRFQ